MKDILIRKATIVCKESGFHNQKRDILIQNGIILAVEESINHNGDYEIVEHENLFVSVGWLDMKANFWDPGNEYREDFESGSAAALDGGFTHVALSPETNPKIAGKTQIEYILNKSRHSALTVLPLAVINISKEGYSLSEMRDLANAGAKGFSSGNTDISNGSFLVYSLMYASDINLPVVLFPLNKDLTLNGVINEGEINVKMGLKGSPEIAEDIETYKLIQLCKYTGKGIHLSPLSSYNSVLQIVNAYNSGVNISGSVGIHYLSFSDKDVEDFNTNLKLYPPLRSSENRLKLINLIKENDSISVVSDHNPQEEDRKNAEFITASYGAIGLQTTFSQLLAIFGKEELNLVVDLLTKRAYKNMQLEFSPLAVNEPANLTLFDPDYKWKLDQASNKSKSINSPLWNMELTGKAIGVINKGQIIKSI